MNPPHHEDALASEPEADGLARDRSRILRMRPRRLEPADLALAKWFYCEKLGGRQVWRDGFSSRRLCFIVFGQPVEVSLISAAAPRVITLRVPDPQQEAERCGDAGLPVQVSSDDAAEQEVSVLDPFGTCIRFIRDARAL